MVPVPIQAAGVTGFTGSYAPSSWERGGMEEGTTDVVPGADPSECEFRYQVKRDGGGVSQRHATFQVVAAGTGEVRFAYRYEIYHAWYDVHASFALLIESDDGIRRYPVVTFANRETTGPRVFTGEVSFPVEAGKTFAIEIGGSNFDFDSRLEGTLKVTGFSAPAEAGQAAQATGDSREAAPLNVLVTAGNTMALIDKVRCLTNVFTGRTGASIALEAHARGHRVTLLTSHPEALTELCPCVPGDERWVVCRYRTFEDLEERMQSAISAGTLDVVIHCAAVSDYLSGGVYAPAKGTTFDVETGRWKGRAPALVDRMAGKVKSDEEELWIRLRRAPKLVDRIRPDWGFGGVLVKFKLEVGLTDDELLEVAERSRAHSGADLMVANTLEDAANHAFIGAGAGAYERVSRGELAARLLRRLEEMVRPSGKP